MDPKSLAAIVHSIDALLDEPEEEQRSCADKLGQAEAVRDALVAQVNALEAEKATATANGEHFKRQLAAQVAATQHAEKGRYDLAVSAQMLAESSSP